MQFISYFSFAASESIDMRPTINYISRTLYSRITDNEFLKFIKYHDYSTFIGIYDSLYSLYIKDFKTYPCVLVVKVFLFCFVSKEVSYNKLVYTPYFFSVTSNAFVLSYYTAWYFND